MGDQGGFSFFLEFAKTRSRTIAISGISRGIDDPDDPRDHSSAADTIWYVFCGAAAVQARERDLSIDSEKEGEYMNAIDKREVDEAISAA